ncbi:MAG TPA: TIGR02206 family membrane protein [Flavobacteriaceae bacterium]|nr:TIGR02206 family membrane protein [Flavobacteriaceae bacterium]
MLFCRVQIGSFEHLVPVICALFFGYVLILKAKNTFSVKKKERIFNGLGFFISTVVVVFHLHKMATGNYNISSDLPLYLCSLLALLIPVFTMYKKFWMYEILFFWIIAGTTQGVITPDIAEGFPSFDYFRYWVVHLGLLVVIGYATFVLNYKPKLKSVFKSFLALQIYVLFVVIINAILNANYFYLNEKPKSASLLDYFGDWPYYLITTQLLIIPLFLLIYLPFYMKEKIISQKAG